MKKYGFTFIEIMITIVVFSIGVFAVLGLVTSNLRGVERNDLRLQGTLLAKEGLELVYNLRDSNLERELPRNCVLASDIFDKDSADLSNWIMENSTSCISQCGDDEDCQANCIMHVICPYYFGKSRPIRVSYSNDNYLVAEHTDEISSGNRLYMHTGSRGELWYSHVSNGGEDTVFSRFITFDDIRENSGSEDLFLDTGKILKVSSHVLWEKGSYTGEVVLESFIGNY